MKLRTDIIVRRVVLASQQAIDMPFRKKLAHLLHAVTFTVWVPLSIVGSVLAMIGAMLVELGDFLHDITAP